MQGFRVDAVPFVIESVEPGPKKSEHHFEYLSEFRRFLQWRRGDAILLGEANVPPEENARYFGEDGATGIHMMFNFFVNQYLFYALATEDAEPLKEAIRATADIPDTAQWANFLRNHDELDLGRLTDEQRERVFQSFAPEEHMQLFGRGIRRRLAPMLGDREHEELAYSLMFSLPGAAVIRFGDELRMGDDLTLEGRDAVRTPMQWADAKNAGFSTADPGDLVHPVIEEGPWGYRHINVEAQRRHSDSFLNWTARMIRLRKQCPEIGWGKCELLETGSPGVIAMRYAWRGNSILIVHNLTDQPYELALSLDDPDGERLSDLLRDGGSAADEDGVHRIRLDALDYRWYRIGGLDYAVHRAPE